MYKMEADLIQKIDSHQLTVSQLREELRKRGAKVSGTKAELEARLREILIESPRSLLRDLYAHRLSVKQLKDELRALGLDTRGNKPELEARLRAHLTEQIVPRPRTPPPSRSPVLPPAPKATPKAPVRVLPKFTTPTGPATVRRVRIPEQEPLPESEIVRLIDLTADVASGRLTLEQMKNELSALNLSTEGTPEIVKERLLAYLNLFSLTKVSRWPLCSVDASAEGDLGYLFDLFWSITTEQIIHALRPGDWISFYDNRQFSYHTDQIKEVVRTPMGLTREIKLNTPGFVITRSRSGNWSLGKQTAFGPTPVTGPIAAHLRMF